MKWTCDSCDVEFTTDEQCLGCEKYRYVDHSKVIDEFVGVLRAFYPDDEFLKSLIEVMDKKLGGHIVEYPKPGIMRKRLTERLRVLFNNDK